MTKSARWSLRKTTVVALTGLNVAVFAFYVLWQIADADAVARAEGATRVDFSQMLPNSELLWIAAHVSVVLTIVVDVMVARLLQQIDRQRRGVADPIEAVSRSDRVG